MADETLNESAAADTAFFGVTKNAVFLAAGIYIVLSIVLMYDFHSRLSKVEQDNKKAIGDLEKRLSAAESNSRATSEALASKLGMTEKELDARTEQLKNSQREIAKTQDDKMNKVTGAIADEVGNVKTDVASTKTELELTKAKLEKTIGDLGVQSGLIARTAEELDILKRKGDRNYYEFTLNKGAAPTPVGTISLQVKKMDAKKSKFNLIVLADDKTIEKKDKTVNEPLQFYTGRDRMLYEVVVNLVDKNKISGYMATPKGAPQAVVQ
jgi:hypothetical protein